MNTRFAPSPTGELHLGSARSALYTWLLARQSGGRFIIRIEDTDQSRSEERYTQSILEDLRWLGLDWDELTVQSHNTLRHKEALQDLLDSNHLYFDQSSSKEAALWRKTHAGRGFRSPHRDAGLCQGALRVKVPEGHLLIDDLVMGETEWDLASIDDFVIAREDGSPTFLLANCVDDLGMDIVVRGLDHQSNSPKQTLLRQMLGPTPVKWAHLPLIVGEDGKKLSKRSSNTESPLSISALRKAGFHPGAIRSVLARLGWGTNHEELLDLPELLESFDLNRVSISPAHFDSKKLRHVNGVKLRSLPLEDYTSELLAYAEHPLDSRAFKAAVCAKPRSQTWEEASNISSFLYLPYTIDPAAWEKAMNQDSLDILSKLKNDIAGYPDDHEKIDTLLHDFTQRANLKPGKAFQPLRVALCGSKIGPALGHLIWALGIDESLKRIQAAISRLQSDNSLIKTEN